MASTRYLKIDTDGTESLVVCEDFRDMQREVEGLITSAPAPFMPDVTAFANDEGILLGMALNRKATERLGYPLYGPVLVGGPTDDEGEVLDYEGPAPA